jgi:hypothetical protein
MIPVCALVVLAAIAGIDRDVVADAEPERAERVDQTVHAIVERRPRQFAAFVDQCGTLRIRVRVARDQFGHGCLEWVSVNGREALLNQHLRLFSRLNIDSKHADELGEPLCFRPR